ARGRDELSAAPPPERIVTPALLLCLFSCACVGAHHVLHSFPTRRSSDLSVEGRQLAFYSRTDQPFRAEISASGTAASGTATLSRSEEHTSELQSPYDLVCRLLLEKKNQSPHGSGRLKAGSVCRPQALGAS